MMRNPVTAGWAAYYASMAAAHEHDGQPHEKVAWSRPCDGRAGVRFGRNGAEEFFSRAFAKADFAKDRHKLGDENRDFVNGGEAASVPGGHGVLLIVPVGFTGTISLTIDGVRA